MKRFLVYSVTCFFILNISQVYSQSKFKGFVKDEKEKLSLFGATVSVTSEGSVLKEETAVDFDGSFAITSTKTFGNIEIQCMVMLHNQFHFQ
ncbi:MAG: hypothetical protein HC854_11995, partial [Flavobacterium sp.]|nr:hypothetical protein [Flavobacterium sp.]